MNVATETFWHAVYRQHSGSLLAFLRGRLGAREDAEDLLQETFVRVLRARHRLRDVDRVRSYLFSTAHHLVINRGRRRRPLLFAELAGEQESEWGGDLAAAIETPEDSARLAQIETRLARALARLSPAHRRAYRLAVVERKTYAEIAASEGWSLPQVKVNVYRARRRLMQELGNDVVAPERSR